MYATLLGIPPSFRATLERELRAAGSQEQSSLFYADSPEVLPRTLPAGMVVLGDPGRSLSELERLCRDLHSRRRLLRSHLVVLTERTGEEARALIQAGADECVAPPGGDWLSRMTSLSRRLAAQGLSGSLPAEEEAASERLSLRAALQALLDNKTQADLGYLFFSNLVEHLSRVFRASCVLVGELLPERDSIRTLAFWLNGSLQRGVVYPLRGTPCDDAIRNTLCHCPDGAGSRFPEDEMLAKLGLRGYLGAALRDGNGNAIGVLAVMNHEPLEADSLEHALLAAFAARAGAELERIRAQEEVERTRDFLRNTLDALPDPLYVMDRAHRWVTVNRAFTAFMQRGEQELLGSSVRDFLPAREAEYLWHHDEYVFSTGQPTENEKTFGEGTPEARTVLMKKAVFHEPGGASFLIGTIRDITDRKRLETQLRLADRLSSIGTLAAGVVHEINNPLAYVCSNLSFLEKSLAQPEVPADALPELREVLAETQEGIQRVRTIAQGVKTFARADENRTGPVQVHPAIEGALRLVRKEVQYRAQLERELEPVPAILGNEGRLGQVLVNLLVNALQAFPQNEAAHNRIRLATRTEGPDTVVIEVEDNGPGMTPEVRQHLFDPFFTTKPVGVGSGLGLAICQSIIQSMGGRIEVESELGRGSLFRLLLPAAQVHESAGTHAREAPLESQGPRRRLLLIDAEPAVGTSVRRLLQEAHEVHAVQDVSVALNLLSRGERYDAILCDVVLPRMSGVDLLRELEQHEPGLARRTGFMSSGAFAIPPREMLGSYSGEFLEKPFEPERLRSFVQRLFT